jgi:Ran GTPase-activating protein (RanGAP) involved in mRNA processing and transport
VLLGGGAAQLVRLRALDLSGCHLGPQGIASIAAALAAHPPSALASLALADNRLGPASIQQLARALEAGTAASSLTSLDLSLNDAGGDVCRQLAALCGRLRGLESLSLASSGIRAEGMTLLAQQLAELRCLTSLQLQSNSLGDAGFGSLAAALPGLPLLRELQLEGSSGVGGEGARLLVPALVACCSQLRRLDLSKTGIGLEGGRQLGALLQVGCLPLSAAAHSAWVDGKVDDWHCNDGSQLNSPARRALQVPGCALEELQLERCGLRAEGVEAMARGLAGCGSLASLGLARNGAGDTGVRALVQALESNAVLSRWATSSARDCTSAVRVCRPVLFEHPLPRAELRNHHVRPPARSLDLSANGMGLLGCKALTGLLKERNASLRRLAVGGNAADALVLEVGWLAACGGSQCWPRQRPSQAAAPPAFMPGQ